MRLPITARWSGYGLLLVALGCLVLAACGNGDISAAANSSPATTPPVIGPVAVTPTPSLSASTATLSCAVHSTEGSEDDEMQQTLTCTVKQAPSTDTHFILRYSVRDPTGGIHPFSQTCNGSLRNGTGSCSQKYEFVFAFSPTSAPITGQSLPSRTPLGPATPST